MQPTEGSASEIAMARARDPHFEPLPPVVSAALDPANLTLAERLARIGARSGHHARYTVLGEVARGGMGKILRVWDEELAREVAMKVVPRQAPLGSSDEERADHETRLARFLDEARITGQLDHPGIVPVHEVGLNELGDVYFTMPLVRGQDLKSAFALVYREKNGWSLQRAVDVMHLVCLTVAFAHKKGVVHRDLKPENIMVGPFGEAYVMDWGLAFLLGRSEKKSVVGTPAYMSPEQAAGHIEDVGPHSDVYSLGAILYELFARRLPHQLSLERRTEDQSFESVLATPPRPLHELRDDVPPDLAAICAKAMAHEPRERYASALEMADDLAAWLAGRVVSAHESGPWTRLKKWRGRNRALALAVDALVALVLVSAAAIIVRERAWLNEVQAKHEEVRLSAYAAGLSAADLGLRAHETGESRRRLAACDPELRGWEWRYLALRADSSTQVLDEHEDAVRSVAVSPDGRFLASGSDDGTVRIWNADSGTRKATLDRHLNVVTAVAFTPDSTRLASASRDKTVLLWDVASGTFERPMATHEGQVVALAFSLDGEVLASGDTEGDLVLTAVADGSPLAHRIPEALEGLVALDFIPGSDEIAAAYISGFVRILGAEELEVRREAKVALSTLTDLDVDPDGTLLAVAFDRESQVLDVETLELVAALASHPRTISSVVFSPDGTRLATSSFDNLVRVWEKKTDRILELEGHDSSVNGVAFFPDGRRLVSGSEDATLRLWDSRRMPVSELVEDRAWILSLAFSPDGSRIVAGTHDQQVLVLDVARGIELASSRTDGIVDCVAWSATGEVAYGCGESAARIAPPGDLASARTLAAGQGFPRTLVFDPAGRRLYERDSKGRVCVHDLEHDRGVTELSTGGDESWSLVLSPDGSRLVAGTTDGEILVWDTRTLAPLASWHPGKTITALAFSPDGHSLAVGRKNRSIVMLSTRTGATVRTLEGHENIVSCLAFSPDGKRLVSGSYDHTLRVWDPEIEEALLILRGHLQPVTVVAFDPGGEIVASASKDGSVRLWRTTESFASPSPTVPDDSK